MSQLLSIFSRKTIAVASTVALLLVSLVPFQSQISHGQAATGTIEITLVGAQGGYTLKDNAGTTIGQNSNGSGLGPFSHAGLPAGTYSVEFNAVSGFDTPATQSSVTVTTGVTTSVTGTYVATAPAIGTLQVTMTGAQGGYSVTDSGNTVVAQTAANSGLGPFTHASLPVGNYTVTFGAVAGFTTPAPNAVTITSGQTTATSGDYLVAPVTTGAVEINLTGAQGGYTLKDNAGTTIGQNSNNSGLGPFTHNGLPAGTYSVEFNVVSGFNTPATQSVTVTTGQTTNVTGAYTATSGGGSSTGSIQVTFVSAQGGYTITDSGSTTVAQTAVNSGLGPFTHSGLIAGSYTVTFTAVSGFTTPVAQSVTVTGGATTTVTGTYLVAPAGTGAIQIALAGAQGGYTLKDSGSTTIGQNSNNSGFGPFTHNGLPAGTYSVEFNVVSGFNTPSTQSVTVLSGQTTTVTGTYTTSGGGGIQPPNAQFTATPSSGGAPLPVTFDASASTGIGTLTYEWDYEGNSAFDTKSEEKNKIVSFIYETPGNFNATLRVTDTGTGLSTTVSKLISVGTYNTGGGTSIWAERDNSIGGGTAGADAGISGLIVEKEVKASGEFVKADTEATALGVGRKKTINVTYQVRVKNLTNLSITKMTLEDAFFGNKKVKQSDIRNVTGASYDAATRQFTVDQTLENGATATFTYEVTLTSSATNALAYNTIKVMDYEVRDNFNPKKSDIGLTDSAYVQFGRATASSTGTTETATTESPTNAFVPTTVTTDKSEVRAGESLTYTITVNNNTTAALTNVVVRDNYDESLVDVTPVNGTSNGSEITFEVGTIEPGQSVTLAYSATVKAEAENTDTTLTNAVSVFTDQYSDQAFAATDVRVAPKFAGFLAGATRTLPKTGLPLAGIALASLAIAAVRTRKTR